MFCNKCGKELIPGVRFCSGCGTPVETAPVATAPIEAAPVTEEPVAEKTAEKRVPVSDTPVFIPEPAKKSNLKLFITIGIIVAMVLVLVLAFFEYKSLSGKLEEEIVENTLEYYGKGLLLYIIAFAVLLVALILVNLFVKKRKKIVFSAPVAAPESGTYAGTTGSLPVFNDAPEKTEEPVVVPIEKVQPAVAEEPVFEPIAEPEPAAVEEPVFEPIAEPESAVAEEPAIESIAETQSVGIEEPVDDVSLLATRIAKPVGEELTNAESVISSTEIIKEEPEKVEFPEEAVTYATAPESFVNEKVATTSKYDINTYNSVDDFEAMNVPSAPVEESPSVSYPTAYPGKEDKKDSGGGWFTAAGDL